MKIETASSKDYETIAAIYNEHIQLGKATMVEKIHSVEDIASWVQHFNEKEKLFVLKIEGTIIGWGIIRRYSERNGYRFAAITSVFITQSETGKGYGSPFKKYIIEQCRKLGYRHLVAKIFASNKTSIQYNLKLGYSMVGIQKEIGFKNGKWQDVAILQMILK